MKHNSRPPGFVPPYTNGNNGHNAPYETPLDASGVSLHQPIPRRKPTTFAADVPLRGFGPTLYALHRFHLGGIPASRYIAALWILIAALAAIGIIPGRWITVTLALLLWASQIIIGMHYRRRHYVSFNPASLPTLAVDPLTPSEKETVFVTGLLNVEGRYQRYTYLPGFYRTFATGEHAIICQVKDRSWLGILSWPEEQAGMWYAFVNPSEIHQLAWGKLRFGNTLYPALAIDYQLEMPPGPRRKKTEVRQETIYLACAEQDSAQRIYVDLLQNLPAEKITASLPVPQS